MYFKTKKRYICLIGLAIQKKHYVYGRYWSYILSFPKAK